MTKSEHRFKSVLKVCIPLLSCPSLVALSILCHLHLDLCSLRDCACQHTLSFSLCSSVLNEGLKYFMTYEVAIRSLRQTNACCCFGPHTHSAF